MFLEKYKKDINTLLLPKECYNPYPKYEERSKWGSIPADIKSTLIKRGEKYLSYKFEQVLATDLVKAASKEYTSPSIIKSHENLTALIECVIAECIEGKERFIPQILNGILLKCEESAWFASANSYMHKNGPCIIPDIDDPIIDLKSARTASTLAFIHYTLISKLDSIDENIGKRLRFEIRKRILKPFYERKDIWWMAFTRKINPIMQILHPINNWTPYCTYHCLTSILLLEDNWEKRQIGVNKSMDIMDNYLNYYSNDGCLDEGVGYWFMAAGATMDYLISLYDVTNGEINIYDNTKIIEMGEFIYKAYVGENYFINYADARTYNECLNNKIVRYARKTNNDTLLRFGLKFYNKTSYMKALETFTDYENTLYYVFNFETIENNFYLNDTRSKDYLLKDVFYESCQVMIARENNYEDNGLFLSCKGGHNDESHNHNDVGNFVIFNDSKPIIIDVGVEAYTKKTFSKNRYDIWSMQSKYHNVPIINSNSQSVGHTFKAKNVTYNKNNDYSELSFSLKDVYSETTGIDYYNRKITLHRNINAYITIEEDFNMYNVDNTFSYTFMTPCKVEEIKKGELILKNYY